MFRSFEQPHTEEDLLNGNEKKRDDVIDPESGEDELIEVIEQKLQAAKAEFRQSLENLSEVIEVNNEDDINDFEEIYDDMVDQIFVEWVQGRYPEYMSDFLHISGQRRKGEPINKAVAEQIHPDLRIDDTINKHPRARTDRGRSRGVTHDGLKKITPSEIMRQLGMKTRENLKGGEEFNQSKGQDRSTININEGDL